MSSVTQNYGANIAFIEELYEKFRNDPNAVSASWREFFHDYEPLAEELEEEIAVGGGQAPPPVVIAPAPQPAPVRTGEAPVLHKVPSDQNLVPLRGAAGKIATNMEASLSVPTATSIRNVPVKVLDENRRV